MRKYAGPIGGGLVAILVATILSRGGLLIPAVLGVGSWWAYKFWPRKPQEDDPRARAFLERLETEPPAKEPDHSAIDERSAADALDVFKNLRH